MTDANGVAVLEGLDPGTEYRFVVNAPQGREDVLWYVAERWKPADETVRLARAFVVKGHVRDAGGRGVAGAAVSRQTGPNAWTGSGSTGEDGAFAFTGLAPGDVTLKAQMEGLWNTPPVTTTVAAGAENVVLTIDPGLELSVRIDNWPSEAPAWSQAALRSETTEGPGLHLWRQVAADGTLRFRGLTAEMTYTLWIPPVGDGLSLKAPGLKARTGEQRLRLVPGKSVSGKFVVPAGGSVNGVNASPPDGAIQVQGVVHPDGTYEVRGLPDGTWRVNAWGRAGDMGLTGNADVAAGGTVDVEMKAR
jgi:hypothetical protein